MQLMSLPNLNKIKQKKFELVMKENYLFFLSPCNEMNKGNVLLSKSFKMNIRVVSVVKNLLDRPSNSLLSCMKALLSLIHS